MNSDLKKILQELLKALNEYGAAQLFFVPNIVGDETSFIASFGPYELYLCYKWRYFKLLGLSDEEESLISTCLNRVSLIDITKLQKLIDNN